MSVENNANFKSRTRLTARYDLGVAVIGAGYQSFDARTTAYEPKTTTVGVSVPLNQFTIGLQQINAKASATQKNKGTAMAVSYALSKRTAVTVQHVSTKEGNAAAIKNLRVRLAHTF